MARSATSSQALTVNQNRKPWDHPRVAVLLVAGFK
jgi:hypothetical protein